MAFVSNTSIFNQFFSDMVTPLEDDIYVPGTKIHCFYAVKMGEEYENRYRRHFVDPDIRYHAMQHEELLACYPEQWVEEVLASCRLDGRGMEENDFEEKGEGYQYAFSCTEDNNFFRFKAEAQKTTGEMTLNIVTDGKSDFSGGSVTVYKIKEDGEEECTPSESAQGVKKYNVNAENDYRIEVKPDRDSGYEFQNSQKPDDYTYDE